LAERQLIGGEGGGDVMDARPGVEAALPGEGAAAAVAGAVVDVLGEELLDPGRVVADERDDEGAATARTRPARS
jgi:hypothetical protein